MTCLHQRGWVVENRADVSLKHFKSCRSVKNDDFQWNMSPKVLSDPVTHCATSPFWCHQGFPEGGTGRTASWGQRNTRFMALYSKWKTAATLRLQTTFTWDKRPWDTLEIEVAEMRVQRFLSPSKKSLSKYTKSITAAFTKNSSCLGSFQILNYCHSQQLWTEGLSHH